MLKVENLQVYYDAIHAIKGVSLDVSQGEIVTLIGANGAGKTTILRTISGLEKAREGKIEYLGKDITSLQAHDVVKIGISQVPEGRRVFTNMSVTENLELGAYLSKDRKAKADSLKRVFEHFPRLYERRTQIAGTLSGGEQQMLAMGRALMSKPKLMMLDEPSMGLAPILVRQIFSIIKEIHKEGTTILLIEQNANMALSIAHRGYVLETGKIVMQGSVQELLASEEIKNAYLGGEAAHS
ncbi:MAG: ABC transporter ATP-binding protein [Dethiobacter sp.]|jgi:branched-chain amino acid transport system ATP-binding protein|nr:ABC transporter ATP-binding protein [Dethiobacter sp.]MBS3898362.1 ABC transporter ATP-binding protein [Dethiobacter sp.]MBS3983128.1 ABC transporter ATP-binding protein [Dethiobacter sp.]MCL4462408.1 ABC transporter ATP-binding protein [Bacillota bacterium]MCL5993871.1 ABC transporter ATP-binding protein [Bacillota bacterium]